MEINWLLISNFRHLRNPINEIVIKVVFIVTVVSICYRISSSSQAWNHPEILRLTVTECLPPIGSCVFVETLLRQARQILFRRAECHSSRRRRFRCTCSVRAHRKSAQHALARRNEAAQKTVKATGGVGRRPMMTLQTSIEVRIIAKRNSAGFKE